MMMSRGRFAPRAEVSISPGSILVVRASTIARTSKCVVELSKGEKKRMASSLTNGLYSFLAKCARVVAELYRVTSRVTFWIKITGDRSVRFWRPIATIRVDGN